MTPKLHANTHTRERGDEAPRWGRAIGETRVEVSAQSARGAMQSLLETRNQRASRPRAPNRISRGGQRGLTLVEMLIVLLIVTLILAGVVMGSGQLAGAKLHKSATTIVGLIRVAYVRATVTARSERIVFDFDNSKFWLEESEQPMLVQTHDTTGTGGASAVTQAEQQAIAEKARLIKGPEAPRPTFKAVKPGLYAASDNQGGSDQSLPFGIKFRAVQTAHDEESRTKGRAYFVFLAGWVDGAREHRVAKRGFARRHRRHDARRVAHHGRRHRQSR